MINDGWERTGVGSWAKTFYDASVMQVPPTGELTRRITRDRATGDWKIYASTDVESIAG